MTRESIHEEHMKRVDAVNAAKTWQEQDAARHELTGFRDGLKAAGVHPDLMACDREQFARGFEHRPMCCGVFLDWKPAGTEDYHVGARAGAQPTTINPEN